MNVYAQAETHIGATKSITVVELCGKAKVVRKESKILENTAKMPR